MGSEPLLTGSLIRPSRFIGLRFAIVTPWLLLAALLIVWGSDRVPADLHRPIAVFPPPTAAVSREDHVDHSQTKFIDQLGNTESVRFEVATFNLHRGKGGRQSASVDGFTNLLKGCDIVALQEDVHVQGKTLSRQLGESLGLWAVELPTEFQWSRPNGGNGLLLRTSPGKVARIPLPNARGKAFRQIALFPVALGELRLTVLATHLDSSTDRPEQWPILVELWKSVSPPCLLMGDLNTEPDDLSIKPLLAVAGTEDVLEVVANRQGFTKAPHIDWIITRGLKTISAEVISTELSDHPVVRAELEWAGPLK